MNKIFSSIRQHKWFFISLILAIIVAFIRFHRGIIQQDNYLDYARVFPDIFKLSFSDTRLFPGLPLLILFINFFVNNLTISGYLVTFMSFTGSYLLLYKMTGSRLSFLFLVFPPILFNLTSLVDTEMPFIFLLLLGVYFLRKNKAFLSFFILGISLWFRLAALGILFGLFLFLLTSKSIRRFFINLPYFLIPALTLFIYDVHFFGPTNFFYQFFFLRNLIASGTMSIGILQLGSDLVRSFQWHWYRIFFSGFFYVVFYSAFYIMSFKKLKEHALEFWLLTGFYSFTLIYSFVPFLEGLGRYLAPTIPIFWLIFHSKFKDSKILYLALPLSVVAVLI
jgi:hypothetical protein